MTPPIFRRVIALVVLLALVTCARGDYLIASRHALVKTAPVREAETIRTVERDDVLVLASPDQTNGYYQVVLEDGRLGWVYRTFVRRFPGLPPDVIDEEQPPEGAEAIVLPPDDDRNVIFGLPTGHDGLLILENVGYTVGYSPESRTPLWVSYRLFTVGDIQGPPRQDKFAADPRVPSPVGSDDYVNSGYDRGHMAPSAPIGRRYGKAAQDKTFLMTNMAPQLPGLNQRGWEAVENIISSDYAERFEEVWVFVGPIFEGSCRELLSDVRIPSHCYMIVVDVRETDNTVRALAIVMPQRRINNEPLSDFVVTIDSIEARTGLDFLHELPDTVEFAIEAAAPDTDWLVTRLLHPSFPGTARPLHSRQCN